MLKTKQFPANLPKAKLSELAKDIVGGLIYTSDHMTDIQMQHNLTSVFMPLALGALSEYSKEQIANIGFVYGYYKDTFKMSINGMPIFHACAFVNKRDGEIIWQKVKKMHELMDKV